MQKANNTVWKILLSRYKTYIDQNVRVHNESFHNALYKALKGDYQ